MFRLTTGAGLLLLLLAMPSHASVFEPRSIEQLRADSDAVAVLRVDSGPVVTAGFQGLPHSSWQATVISPSSTALGAGERITIREIGGDLNGRGLLVSGIPRFEPGDTLLAFLVRNDDGSWRTSHHSLGAFYLENGRWNRRDVAVMGGERLEPSDSLSAAQVRGIMGNAAADYLLVGSAAGGEHPVRHEGFALRSRLPMRVTGDSARMPSARQMIDRAMLAWNRDDGSHVFLWREGDGDAAYAIEDGVSAIVLDATIPNTDASVVGQTYLFYSSTPSSDAAGTYYAITEVDVAVRPITNSTVYQEVLTHELGHALGFRHSNEGNPSSSDAVMNSSISGQFGAELGSWDRGALAAVYPLISCASPDVQIASDRPRVREGEGVIVTATTSAPSEVRWYAGSPGDRRQPLGSGSELALKDLRASVRIWALAENDCGFANSSSIQIAVEVCHEITLFEITPDQTVAPGTTVSLDVQHGGSGEFTYTWYEGALGDTSRPVGAQRAVALPVARTTSFWVRIKSDCAALDAGAVKITVQGSGGRRRGAHPRPK